MANSLAASQPRFNWLREPSSQHQFENPAPAIYRLIPPTGYKCLGHVTVGWPVGTQTHSPPELNNYRCVKSEYLEDVQYKSLIWDTRGTGE